MRIGKDKIKHLTAGAAIFVVVFLIMRDPEVAIAAAAVIGFGKEVIWDELLGRGTPEILDFIFTVAGALVLYLAILIL